MKLTKLLPTKFIAVEVPFMPSIEQNELVNTFISKNRGNIQNWYPPIDFPGKAKLRHVGEITKDYVSINLNKLRHVGLTIKEANELLKDDNDSICIRKLLKYNELYFEHPLGNLESCCSGSDCGCMGMPIGFSSKEEFDEYMEIESKLINGKLIIFEEL